eukprot:CAMPEP_0197457450 /NCGR_PEP_ID=MMETSP1175-20131217/46067_1 /TAXON_ID=1003142 /ORGANISM="Triceratium dubium, Strain CCMP147" /LENGTH=56 /DNA_ID=CAMNT_0042991823 /DNA_START=81 /DNA_END=248 /DNA_ORIENTATION=+
MDPLHDVSDHVLLLAIAAALDHFHQISEFRAALLPEVGQVLVQLVGPANPCHRLAP